MKTYYSLILIVLVVFVSCKKHTDGPQIPTSGPTTITDRASAPLPAIAIDTFTGAYSDSSYDWTTYVSSAPLHGCLFFVTHSNLHTDSVIITSFGCVPVTYDSFSLDNTCQFIADTFVHSSSWTFDKYPFTYALVSDSIRITWRYNTTCGPDVIWHKCRFSGAKVH